MKPPNKFYIIVFMFLWPYLFVYLAVIALASGFIGHLKRV